MPPGGHPTAVAFGDDSASVVVASQTLSGCSLYMFLDESAKTANETKQPAKPPVTKWEHPKIHDKRAILTLFGTTASYGNADESTILVSCSEGIL